MTSLTPIVHNWGLQTLEEFKAANPHLHNHSSRTVLDPEEPVATLLEKESNTASD
jgi:hypothetical protein